MNQTNQITTSIHKYKISEHIKLYPFCQKWRLFESQVPVSKEKCRLTHTGNCNVEIRLSVSTKTSIRNIRQLWDCLISIMGISISGKMVLILKQAQDSTNASQLIPVNTRKVLPFPICNQPLHINYLLSTPTETTNRLVLSSIGIQTHLINLRKKWHLNVAVEWHHYPDNKVHGANMGPTWVLSAPDGPHVGPMNFASWVYSQKCFI